MNTTLGNILIIDDEEKIRHLLARILNLEGYQVSEACNARSGLKLLDEDTPDVVICDVKLPDADGVDLLKTIKQKSPYSEVILLTAHGNVKDAVKSVRNGAFDYLTKGDDNDRIIPLLARAIDKVKLENKVRTLETQLQPLQDFSKILGISPTLSEAIDLAKKVAPTDVTVLLLGETGTGKEVFADAIRRASNRKNKPFVAVNCSSFSKELLESELFGYKVGAFTGAIKDKKGLIEEAQYGTLFLDEIGEMPSEVQAKLLRVLESGEFMKPGDTKTYKADVRIIAATHRNLPMEVREGRFREDLYYRLAVLVLKVPALREREGDLGFLVDKLLGKLNTEFGSRPGTVSKKLSVGARNLLLRHSWPGNVRELESTLRRAFVWSKGATLDEGELRDALLSAPRAASADVLGRPLGEGFKLADVLRDVARHYLSRAMEEADGNLSKASSLVGLANYQTLKNWLRKYGVEA